MKYIFLDLEMLCDNWKSSPNATMEIIRIAAIKYNDDFTNEEIYHTYVKPIIGTKVSKYCTKLTGITTDDIQNAPIFSDIWTSLNKFLDVNNAKLITWGDNDIPKLKQTLKVFDISPSKNLNNIFNSYINFSNVTKKQMFRQNVSLNKALSEYKLEFEGEKHNPIYDAKNLATFYKVYYSSPWTEKLKLLKDFRCREYDMNRFNIVRDLIYKNEPIDQELNQLKIEFESEFKNELLILYDNLNKSFISKAKKQIDNFINKYIMFYNNSYWTINNVQKAMKYIIYCHHGLSAIGNVYSPYYSLFKNKQVDYGFIKENIDRAILSL